MLNKILTLPGLIILLFISTATSFGQTDYQDVVYLKNGSIIRGMIIEQIPNKSIKIETSDRNVFVFQLEEVEKITKEAKLDRFESSKEDKKGYLEPGYEGSVQLGYAFGVGDLGMDFIKLHFINGHRISNSFSIGFGTGVHYYPKGNFSWKEAALIPLFIRMQGNIPADVASPFLAFDLGYSLDATNDFNGVGALISPLLGVMIPTKKSSVSFSVAYHIQKMKFIQYNYYYGGFFPISTIVTGNSGTISLNLGLTF